MMNQLPPAVQQLLMRRAAMMHQPQAFRSGGMPHRAAAQAPLGMVRNPLLGGMHRLGMSNPLAVRPKFEFGGMQPRPNAAVLTAAMPPRAAAPPSEPVHKGGPLRSPIPGRTDHIPVTVPEGAYVIPADVVNHFGEDNTEAGHRVLDALFKGSQVAALHRAAGPAAGRQPLIPIAAAGGEFVVPPETVAHIGGGDMKRGHAILDAFVRNSRAEHIKTLKGLPGPQGASKGMKRAA